MGRLSELHYKLPVWMKSEIFLGVVTLILWLISAVFSLYVMLEFQQMILRVYGTCCFDRWGFQVLRQWSTILFVGSTIQ